MASYRYERDIKPEDLIQETPPPLTPAQQRANWWHYHWYYVVLIAAALLAVGYFIWNRVTEVQPDNTVAVVSRTDPDTAFLSHLETRLETLAGDVNGDGKVKVTVKGIWLALDFETQDAALQRLMQSSEDKLNSDFYLCESALFIVDDPTAMEQRYSCFQTLDGTDPEEGDVLLVSGFALPLQGTALANVQSESTTLWYAARRLNAGMDADTAAALNALWEKLGVRFAKAYSLHRHDAVQGFGISQQVFLQRKISRCIYVCIACGCYEVSQGAFQI